MFQVKFLHSDIKSKNEEMKTIRRDNETQCQQLQTTVFKLKMDERQKVEHLALLYIEKNKINIFFILFLF